MNNAKLGKPDADDTDGSVEKNYWRIIPRYSPEWINSIPRSLARGIWDFIQDSVDERPARSGKRESARRRRQIAASVLRVESRGTAETADMGGDGQEGGGAGGAVEVKE